MGYNENPTVKGTIMSTPLAILLIFVALLIAGAAYYYHVTTIRRLKADARTALRNQAMDLNLAAFERGVAAGKAAMKEKKKVDPETMLIAS